MKEDLTLIDGIRLEVGKEYWIQYIHCESKWNKVKITRITQHGHPWSESVGTHGHQRNGIVTDSYRVQELTDDVNLEQFARTWLQEKGYNAFANLTPMPKWFAEMYNDFGPSIKDDK